MSFQLFVEWNGDVHAGDPLDRRIQVVNAAFLEKEKVAPWSDLPVWVGSGTDAGFAQISAAVLGDTREKSLERKPPTQWLLVSCSIFIRTPSSMP